MAEIYRNLIVYICYKLRNPVYGLRGRGGGILDKEQVFGLNSKKKTVGF